MASRTSTVDVECQLFGVTASNPGMTNVNGVTMDAFQRAVEDARRQLGISQGRQVSVSEMLRLAGFSDTASDASGGLTIKGARYHLEEGNNRMRKGGHRVPAELVTRLARVLPISEEELRRAAQVAAGFNVQHDTGRADLPTILARYLGDNEVSEREKIETTTRMLQIIAEQQARLRNESAD